MQHHPVASQEQWLAARQALLLKEKEFTHLRDKINAERLALPWVKVERSYVFDTPNGKKNLSELFDGRSQLIVYHFMLGPGWGAGCPGCSFLSDHIDGALPHLEHHDVTWTAVSRAPLEEIEVYKKRMGWRFPWVSAFGTDFNYDFGVTLDAEHTVYNYAPVTAQPEQRPHEGEREGLSVFIRDGTRVFHTYSTYQRGLDPLLNTYNLLDLTPLGRQEEDGIMHWLKYHDEY